MIKAIVFDCFGVLTADTWREFTATLPEEQRIEASELNRQYGAAYLSKQEFLQSIKALTGKQPKDIDLLLNTETTKNLVLLQYIAELKSDYKIGLLSNVGNNWVRDKFLSTEEQGLFDEFLFSYEIRIAKPDPEAFKMIAERLGVEVSECVMIDDVEYNCSVASSLGMKTVWYDNFQQTKSDLSRLLADSVS